jgi:hypothetical protein
MSSSPLRVAAVLFVVCCLSVVTAFAADDKDTAKRDPAPAADAQPAADRKATDKKNASTPSPQDFQAFMEMNKPGEHHAHLKRLVGTFDVESEMIMAPGAPPQKTKGVQKSEMVLDGRYLHGDYSGDMMGMPFRGMSLMGYDNHKKKYFNAWIDSMSTGLVTFDGTCDKDGKVFTFTGEYDDPMTQRKTKVRHVTRVLSADKHTFEWFDTLENGKEHRSMFITYTRRK